MDTRYRTIDWVVLGTLLSLAAVTFGLGVQWGLPSHRPDAYLFGDHPVWTGRQIMALAPELADPDRGADVDANPIRNRSAAVLLNETDPQRAEIVRRYRLYSYQPDEMITFRSLGGMAPARGDFDPRLYQYGGLWIYPVGAILRLGGMVGLIDLRSDKAWYLDHPEQFGRLYVAARAYSAAWGLVGVVAIYVLVRRMTGGSILGAAAACTSFALMPAVINGAHEAKPHLAGAALTLLAVAAGGAYVRRGKRSYWIATSVVCGGAMGMVVSGTLSLVILPMMVLLRPDNLSKRLRTLIFSVLCALSTYAISNPFVLYNAVARPERLKSNLGNSTAMYRINGSGAINAAKLIVEGASPVIASAGTLAVVVAMRRVFRTDLEECSPEGWLLGAVATVVLIQFVLLAAGKPGEYGRFALIPDVVLAIALSSTLAGRGGSVGPIMRGIVLVGLVAGVSPFGIQYLAGFIRDANPVTSRLRGADDLSRIPGNIGLFDEPAPYSMPPVNLFDRALILMPAGRSPRPSETIVDFTLRPIDDPARRAPGSELIPVHWRSWRPTLISWAATRFELNPLRGFRADTGPMSTDRVALLTRRD